MTQNQLPAIIPPGALTTKADTYIVPALIVAAGDAAGWRYTVVSALPTTQGKGRCVELLSEENRGSSAAPTAADKERLSCTASSSPPK